MSGQLLSRKNALKLLKRYTDSSQEVEESAHISPAEQLLVDAVIGVTLLKERVVKEGNALLKLSERDEIAFSSMKFVARSLGHFPISEDQLKSYLVRARMKIQTGCFSKDHKYVDGKKRYVYFIDTFQEK